MRSLQILLIEDSESDAALFESTVLTRLNAPAELVHKRTIWQALAWLKANREATGLAPDFIFFDPVGPIQGSLQKAIERLSEFVPREYMQAVIDPAEADKVVRRIENYLGQQAIHQKNEPNELADALKMLMAKRTSGAGGKDLIRVEVAVAKLEIRVDDHDKAIDQADTTLERINVLLFQGGKKGEPSISQMAWEADHKADSIQQGLIDLARDVAALKARVEAVEVAKDEALQIRLKRMDLLSAIGKWPVFLAIAIASLAVASFLGMDVEHLIQLLEALK